MRQRLTNVFWIYLFSLNLLFTITIHSTIHSNPNLDFHLFFFSFWNPTNPCPLWKLYSLLFSSLFPTKKPNPNSSKPKLYQICPWFSKSDFVVLPCPTSIWYQSKDFRSCLHNQGDYLREDWAMMSAMILFFKSWPINLITLLGIFVIEKYSNFKLWWMTLLTFTQKIEKRLNTRISACSKASFFY